MGGTGLVLVDSGVVDSINLFAGVYIAGTTDASRIFFNGEQQNTFTDNSNNDAQTQTFIGFDGDNNPFDGDLAEVIIYNTDLDDCAIFQVNDYLGNKYGDNFNNIAALFGGDTNTFDVDTNGLGAFVSNCAGAVVDTVTTGILTVAEPSNLSGQSGSFLITASDGGTQTFSSSNVPSSLDGRLNRVWQSDVVNSGVGAVTLTFDLNGLIDVSGNNTFTLLVDTDTDFSSGATLTAASNFNAASETVVFSNVDFPDLSFFSLGYEYEPSETLTVISAMPDVVDADNFDEAVITIQVVDNASTLR